MIIYEITNLINGKKYIGKDKNNNPNYLGSGKLIIKAIEKYGKENFQKEILEYCETYEHMCEREIVWIDKFNAIQSETYYNLGIGGHGGDNWHNRKDTKEYHEFVEKMKTINNQPRINTKHSDTTKNNQKKSAIGRYTLPWFIEKYGIELGNDKYIQRNKMLSNRNLRNNNNPAWRNIDRCDLENLIIQNKSQKEILLELQISESCLRNKLDLFWNTRSLKHARRILK